MPGLMLTVTRVKQVNANSVYDDMIAGLGVETHEVSNDVVLA